MNTTLVQNSENRGSPLLVPSPEEASKDGGG
jgi:hypothetical protein